MYPSREIIGLSLRQVMVITVEHPLRNLLNLIVFSDAPPWRARNGHDPELWAGHIPPTRGPRGGHAEVKAHSKGDLQPGTLVTSSASPVLCLRLQQVVVFHRVLSVSVHSPAFPGCVSVMKTSTSFNQWPVSMHISSGLNLEEGPLISQGDWLKWTGSQWTCRLRSLPFTAK